MKISLNHLKIAATCPRKASFTLKSSLPNILSDADILSAVIQKAYIRSMEYGAKINWRVILGWIDSAVFKDIDITNEEVFEKAKLRAEYLLSFTRTWYKKMYLPEHDIVYTGIPIQRMLSSNEISTVIPIVKLREIPTILWVKDTAPSVKDLYNDLEIRGQMLFLARELNVNKIAGECLFYGEKGGYNKLQIYFGKKDLARIENILLQLAAITGKADWPSVGEHCSMCRFQSKCKL